tara:strand:- start:7138 stop:7962 length:825 start_codon:yes stop_codon:yes gene_type:complete
MFFINTDGSSISCVHTSLPIAKLNEALSSHKSAIKEFGLCIPLEQVFRMLSLRNIPFNKELKFFDEKYQPCARPKIVDLKVAMDGQNQLTYSLLCGDAVKLNNLRFVDNKRDIVRSLTLSTFTAFQLDKLANNPVQQYLSDWRFGDTLKGSTVLQEFINVPLELIDGTSVKWTGNGFDINGEASFEQLEQLTNVFEPYYRANKLKLDEWNARPGQLLEILLGTSTEFDFEISEELSQSSVFKQYIEILKNFNEVVTDKKLRLLAVMIGYEFLVN